jgi:hypothetical protein
VGDGSWKQPYFNSAGTRNGVYNFFPGASRSSLSPNRHSVSTVHRTCLHNLACVDPLCISVPDAKEPCGVEWVPLSQGHLMMILWVVGYMLFVRLVNASKYLTTLYSVVYCRVLGIHMLGHAYQVTDEECKSVCSRGL